MAEALAHEVGIEADPQRVFDAVSTGAGLSSFWTRDSQAEPAVGSTARFGFGGPVMEMRVDELEPGKRVRWTALSDWPNWPGTTVTWDIGEHEGHTLLKFSHAGWPPDLAQEELGSVNYTWGQVVGRLKAYAETSTPNPFFS